MIPSRIKTGITGFDKLCQGGFVKNSVNLISGAAGTGKTIFALQFLHDGIKAGEKGIYFSFEENLEDLKSDSLMFGWEFDILEREKKCRFIYIYPYEISNFQTQLIGEVTRIGAKRVVIDSTSAFGMALENDYEVRKNLFTLITELKKLDCTAIITSEIVASENVGSSLSRFGVEEFVSDSVITLHNDSSKSQRSIEIVKMRRTNHNKGPVIMKITDKGILVGK